MTAIPPRPDRRFRPLRWVTNPVSLLYPATDPLTLPPDLDSATPGLSTTLPPANDPIEEVAHLRRRVAQLHMAGAVDEGTSTVLDGRTTAVHDIREVRVGLDYLNKWWLLRHHQALLKARVAMRDKEITVLEQQLKELDRAILDEVTERENRRNRPRPRGRQHRSDDTTGQEETR